MGTTISPSVFLSKCESRLRDERASKDPEDMSFAHAVSGNSLHNFVLENLFVYNEISGIGRTPWRSIANRYGAGILRLALPFASSGSCSLRKTEGYCIQPKLRHYCHPAVVGLLNFHSFAVRQKLFLSFFVVRQKLYPSVFLSDSEGACDRGESKDPEKVSFAMSQQGVLPMIYLPDTPACP